ncbi:MAG: ATP-binding protein [Planctomycetota bacterium]|nr:ATP-binding protein [Planctomycetota bacterium]
MHARTYEAVLERARTALARGRAAILDATYLRRDTRDEVRAFARALGAPYAVLDVTCDPEVVRERLLERARRNDDASDGDQAIYDAMVRTAEPLEGEELALVATHASGEPPEACILPLLDVLEAQLDAGREALGPEMP